MRYDMDDEHCEGYWRERTHHECALVRIAAREMQLADERERREAAEGILRNIRNRGSADWDTLAIDAYFTRYEK